MRTAMMASSVWDWFWRPFDVLMFLADLMVVSIVRLVVFGRPDLVGVVRQGRFFQQLPQSLCLRVLSVFFPLQHSPRLLFLS